MFDPYNHYSRESFSLNKGRRPTIWYPEGGMAVFWKKKSPAVETKKNSLTWGVKKKEEKQTNKRTNKQTSLPKAAEKKIIQPGPEIQWWNGNFWRK